LTLSQQRKKWIAGVYGRDDAVVLYYGVDTKFFRKTEDRVLSKRYKNKKIILHSTDFTAIKGTKYLIKALPRIVDKFPNVLLLITHTLKNQKAKGGILNLAKKLGVSRNVRFLGLVKKEKLPFYYSLAKVVVQPSIGQSMNLFALEALACETPIIISLEGKEQTKNGEAGFLVDPRNARKLAKKIIELIKFPREAREMGKRGRQIVLKKFFWNAVAERFWKVICETRDERT